jgi:hypothetical protein
MVGWVFVDASEMQDAFLPVGLYMLAGDKVTINLNLLRNNKPVGMVINSPNKLFGDISAFAYFLIPCLD